MTLSAEELAGLSRAAGGVGGGTGTEHRRAARSYRRGSVTIAPVADGRVATAQSVTLRDLSARGMSFLYHSRLARGSQFLMPLVGDGGRRTPLLCTVAHCRAVANGLFQVGAEFTCVAPPALEGSAASEQERRIRESIFEG